MTESASALTSAGTKMPKLRKLLPMLRTRLLTRSFGNVGNSSQTTFDSQDMSMLWEKKMLS